MTGRPASSVLPAERDDPLDRVLDMVEANVETAIAMGLEPQIRARLARLLPSPPAPSPVAESFVGAGDSPAGSRPPAPVAEAYTPLDLAAVLTVCRDLETFKLRAAQHAAIARLKGWLVAEISRRNGANT